MAIKVNYSLNKKYFVEKEVIEEIVNKAVQESKNLELVMLGIKISQQKENFLANLKVNIKRGTTFTEAIKEVQENIETYAYNLIDLKPENISIEIQGEF